MDQTTKLESLFPLIEELGADAYWVDDECRYVHYARGSFSNDTSVDGGCRVWEYPDPIAFDATANADIDRLIGAIRDAGLPVDYFNIDHAGTKGRVGPESYFSIGYCNVLIYHPGLTSVPTPDPDAADPELIAQLTPDWYEHAC